MSATGRGRWFRRDAGAVAPGRAPMTVALALLAAATVVPVVPTVAPAAAQVPSATTVPAPAPAPAAGPAPAPPVTTVDPSPRIRVLLARIAVVDARAALVTARQAATTALADEGAARRELGRVRRVRDAAEGHLGWTEEQLATTAVAAYTDVSGGDLVPVLGGDFDGQAQEQQPFSATLHHHRQQVAEAEVQLAGAEAELDAAREALVAARSAADEQRSLVRRAQQDLTAATRDVQAALVAQAQPPDWSTWQLTIEGPSAFTAGELARWYDEQGEGSRASVPAAELARLFVEEGDAEGIRGDMAFAQAIHETGWFTNRDTVLRNNFAGIGHCDACGQGFPFATAQEGVLAQIQLLESYARVDPVYERPRVDPSLNGPAGCCQTWNQLGGVWATDGGYGPRILTRYAEMLEWLLIERMAAAPPPR